jgi:myo-inositol-1(or 4)-monophosphatase
MTDFATELDAATRAAAEAGEIIRGSYAKLNEADIGEKAVNDMVTVVDIESQKRVVGRIRAAFPGDYIVAEEQLDPAVNEGLDPDGARRWFIDPLDGTTNYIHAYPVFAVNIALEVDRTMSVGVTYNPLLDETFRAARGSGAFLNDKPIHVSRVSERNRTLLGTGFPFRSRQYLDIYLRSFRYFFNNSRGIRRCGAAALDLAHVAAGRLDAFWELTLSPWDMAAGVVLIEEAGGRVTDFYGGDSYLKEGHIVASNDRFHDWMIQSLGEIFDKNERYNLPEEPQR